MSYDVIVRRKEISALFDLKGRAADLTVWTGETLPPFPKVPNTLETSGDLTLLWIGRDHWLLRAPLSREPDLVETLRAETAPAGVSIVLVSDTLEFFDVTGPDAEQVMAVATPLDLHERAFPSDGATFTEAFGLKALVLRQPGGFELAVERSFAAMTEDYFARATAC